MSLRRRLLWLLAAGAVVVLAATAVTALSLSDLLSDRATLLDRIDPASLEADQLLLAYVNQETGVRGFVLSHEKAFLTPYTEGLTEQRRAQAALELDVIGQGKLPELADRVEAAGLAWQEDYARPAVAAVEHGGGQGDSSDAILQQSKALFDTLRTRFATLQAALSSSRANAGAQLDSSTNALIGVLAGSFLLVLLTALAISRALRSWVRRPLLVLGADARAVAGGDVAHRIAPVGATEFQRLAADMEAMRARIVLELDQTESARAALDERNRELARSNVELEQFAYVASHDLQEPLRKVTSFVQLLRDRYAGQLDERADQYIEFAVDGSRRMQLLINDLLMLSRVGRGTEGRMRVALGSTVETALANLASLLEETGGHVTVGILPTVSANPSLLVSLWQNLIGNSLKFRRPDPPLIEIDATETAGAWLFRVSDNGIGIEPRFAEKIFGLFQRLHTREEYDGTGIGLSLCKKIVEVHGGKIWLDQEYRAGARICFTLPRHGEEVRGDRDD